MSDPENSVQELPEAADQMESDSDDQSRLAMEAASRTPEDTSAGRADPDPGTARPLDPGQAFHDAPLAMVVLDREMRVRAWNTAAQTMFGWRGEEVLGRFPPTLLGPEEDNFRNLVRVSQTGARMRDMETLRVRKDGVRLECAMSLAPLYLSPEGEGHAPIPPEQAPYALEILTDIGLRKQAEGELERMRGFSMRLLETSPNTIYVYDLLQGVNVYQNRSALEAIGYTPEEIQALGVDLIRRLVHPEDQSYVADHFRRMLAAKEGELYDFQYRMRSKAGEWRWFHSRDTVFSRAEDGRVREIIGAAEDVTDRKRVEERLKRLNKVLEGKYAERTRELEAVNKELESFASTVSHDLRAPLRHIDGFLALLLKRSASLDEDGREYATLARDAAARLGKLIDALLSFSRLGRKRLEMRRVELGELVRSILKDMETETAGRDIEWAVGELPAVQGDADLLRAALQNLVQNAVKFTRPRSPARIEIGAKPDPGSPGRVVVHVRDNGVGFDMGSAHRLFGVFQRLHGEREYEGTGIGLANVQRIVVRHGGMVWAESEPEKGASFYFTVPSADAPPSVAEPSVDPETL